LTKWARVPEIRWDLTTSTVLTMEFVEGTTFLALCRAHEQGQTEEVRRLSGGADLDKVVERLGNECFHQLFNTGLFHGDPHPGNVVLQPDGRFAFLALGIAGELTGRHREVLRSFVENLAHGRYSESAEDYSALCVLTAETDDDAWLGDLTEVLADWRESALDPDAPLHRRHIGRLQGGIAGAMRRNAVRTRPNQLLVWRALVMMDTTTLRLPVQFDLIRSMTAFFRARQARAAFRPPDWEDTWPLTAAQRGLATMRRAGGPRGQPVQALRSAVRPTGATSARDVLLLVACAIATGVAVIVPYSGLFAVAVGSTAGALLLGRAVTRQTRG
jgi:predicted unusual protein kinase regulating ubiquinone biosynthesis (AarF/ABC1/UbiB family)